MTMPDKLMPKPDPQNTAFLFRLCLVEQNGADLTVTVPAQGLVWRGATVDASGNAVWTQAAPLPPAALRVTCAQGTPHRRDRSEYPPSPRFTDGVGIVFSGAADFGRLVDAASAALLVEGSVRAIEGLPAGVSWSGFYTIELSSAPAAGVPAAPIAAASPTVTALEGPHLPYP
jgi:hypothetical protein